MLALIAIVPLILQPSVVVISLKYKFIGVILDLDVCHLETFRPYVKVYLVLSRLFMTT